MFECTGMHLISIVIFLLLNNLDIYLLSLDHILAQNSESPLEYGTKPP